MKTCSNAEVVSFPVEREYNVNQMLFIIRLNSPLVSPSAPADVWREFSGVNITLILTAGSAPSV